MPCSLSPLPQPSLPAHVANFYRGGRIWRSPRGHLGSNDSSRSALRPDPGDEPTVHKWLPVPLFPSVHHHLVLRVVLPGPDLLDLIPLADDQVHAALSDASSHL